MEQSQIAKIKIIEPRTARYDLKDRSVLLIDSGLGLLSIARAIHQEYPMIKLFAIADSEGFPWGGKTKDALIRRTAILAEYGIKQWNIDAIVIACNTASVIVLEHLRKRFSVPIIGVVPAIKPAAHYSKKGIIGVLATESTIGRPYVQDLIVNFADDCKVVMVGSKILAKIAEDKLQNHPVEKAIIASEIAPFMEHKVDAIALACTHYPLLLEEFLDLTDGKIKFFDPSAAVAYQLARKLTAIKPASKIIPMDNSLFATGSLYRLNPAFFRKYGFKKLETLDLSDVR